MLVKRTITALGLLVATAAYGQTAGTPAAPAGGPPMSGMKDTGPPPPPPPLPHPATEAQLRELLTLTDTPGRVHKDLNQATEVLRSRFPPYIPSGVWLEIESKLQGLDVVQIYLPYYQAYISEQDMAALIAFYRTDVGKHYAAVQGTMVAAAQMRLSGNAQAIMQGVLTEHKDEIEAAKRKNDGQTVPAPK